MVTSGPGQDELAGGDACFREKLLMPVTRTGSYAFHRTSLSLAVIRAGGIGQDFTCTHMPRQTNSTSS